MPTAILSVRVHVSQRTQSLTFAVEPDLSNPTRNRWERPLDTIRSFEAAIDGEYKRRSIVMRGGELQTGNRVLQSN